MSGPIIETYSLRRTFRRRGADIVAVDGLDLQVEAGEIFGFLGPNGAGKTTTIRMLATLLSPSGGEGTVAGCDLRRERQLVRRRIGYVAQAAAADPVVPGRAELIFQGRLFGMSRQEARHRAEELIELLDLETCADRPIKTYSGGQRRRIDLALGIVHRPRLLFLDEPTAGLDPQVRSRIWCEVRRLRDAGATIVLTTHYMDEADTLCDRIAIIDRGRVAAQGPVQQLKRQLAGDVVTLRVTGDSSTIERIVARQPFVREMALVGDVVRLTVDSGETAIPVIIRLLDAAGLSIRTLSLHRPSLEDVFLRQTGRSLREAS